LDKKSLKNKKKIFNKNQNTKNQKNKKKRLLKKRLQKNINIKEKVRK